MPKNDRVVANGESLALSWELNDQTVTLSEKENTMNNNNSKLAGRNIPLTLDGDTFTEEIFHGIQMRKYVNGVISFGEKSLIGKANFHTFAQIRGFFSALATVMDNPEGEFRSGFHLAQGREYVKNVWDAPTEYGRPKPVAYVNFGLLEDAETLKWLANQGIKPGKSGKNWLALSASHGKLYPLYTIHFETRDDFITRVSKIIEGEPTEWKDLPFTFRNGYERNEATYHKHYGIEAVLRLVAGTLKVVVDPKNVLDWQAPRLLKQFGLLFATKEERQAHYQEFVASKNLQGKLRRTTNAFSNATEDEPISTSEYVASAEELGVVDVWTDDGITEVPMDTLFKKSVCFVRADGSTAVPGHAWIKDSKDAVLGAMATAETFGAYIKLAE